MSPREMVLQLMLRDPLKWWYGREICQATRLGAGTVLKVLYSLRQDGMVEEKWENREEAAAERRPPRMFYRLKGIGQTIARRELDQDPSGNRRLRPGTAPA